MKQLKRILAAVFAVFGNFNFRRTGRIFGALCLSAVLGIGNAAFADIGNATTGERITTMPERIDIAARDPDAIGIHLWGRRDDGSAHIHDAAWKNDLGWLRHYLLNGENVNVQMNNGRTPLHFAAKHGHVKIAKELVKYDANLELKEEFGKTPLHFAAGIGGGKITEYLIEEGANIEAKDVDGRTPLHWAAHEGKAGAVRALLKNGAEKDAKDKAGRTPLWYAVENFREGASAELAKAGAENSFVNERERFGRKWTRLHRATRNNDTKLMKVLLAAGADKEAKAHLDFTAMHIAAWYNHVDAIEVLIAARADMFPMSLHYGGDTPIEVAYRRSKHDAANYLGRRDWRMRHLRVEAADNDKRYHFCRKSYSAKRCRTWYHWDWNVLPRFF